MWGRTKGVSPAPGAHRYIRSAAQPASAQPAHSKSPPSGVTAPSARTPVSVITYRLPENNAMPLAKHSPAHVGKGPGTRLAKNATKPSARA